MADSAFTGDGRLADGEQAAALSDLVDVLAARAGALDAQAA
jgi:hypothetical protein